MKRWFGPAFLLIIALAMALRAPRLGLRPMHNDEAVNAMRFRDLWVSNSYQYDPDEFHGPTIEYFTLPAAWLDRARDFNGFTEATFRSVTVAFGVGLILLLLPLARDLGKAETLWAALLTALSPAMVFYSRYYIHEMLLVFFTALTLVAAWRYTRAKTLGWCLLAGAGLGLMYATKETFVFAAFSMAAAAGCTAAWTRWMQRERIDFRSYLNFKHIAAALGLAAGVAALFFSSFLTNAGGPLDALKTYLPWLRRAGGASPHVHAWSFYFERLLFFHAKGGPIWSEALIAVLAAVGWVAALAGKGLGETNVALARFLGFFTLWLTVIYAALAYKTPWCLLGFLYGMILLAGVGATALARLLPVYGLVRAGWVILPALCAQLGWQAWRASFGTDSGGACYCVSPRNPYVYSQTGTDLLNLVDKVEAIARVSPQGLGIPVEVMSEESYWPLPWYLRRFKSVGFWDHIPSQPPAPIMIVSAQLHAAFDQGDAKTHLMAGYFQLRPRVFVELYVAINLWTDYVKTLPKERDD
jgi:uncharacterized protein (TIGR03663 family)